MFRLVCVLVFSICDLVHELVRIHIYIYSKATDDRDPATSSDARDEAWSRRCLARGKSHAAKARMVYSLMLRDIPCVFRVACVLVTVSWQVPTILRRHRFKSAGPRNPQLLACSKDSKATRVAHIRFVVYVLGVEVLGWHILYIYTHTIYLLSSLRHVPLQVKSMKPVKSSPKKRNVPSPDTAKSTKRCKAARPQSGVHMFGMVWEHRAAQN